MERPTVHSRLVSRVALPTWGLAAIILVGCFNMIIFLSVVTAYLWPTTMPVAITGDVAIAMHIQLLEVFLSALGIGLAVFGFIGFAAIREAAERRAEDAARTMISELLPRHFDLNSRPDLSGLSESKVKTQPETDV